MKHAKKKGFWKVIGKGIRNIASLCTIVEFVCVTSKVILSVEFESTYAVQEETSISQSIFNAYIDYFSNNWLLFILQLFFNIFFVKAVCIPLYKIYIKKEQPQKAKPFFSDMVILAFMAVCLFCYHVIESYIIRSNVEIIPVNELNNLTDDELYYIRNGIFAYCGQRFESGYYDEFSWYIPRYSSNEVWEYMNPCQRQNIENIQSIENQR